MFIENVKKKCFSVFNIVILNIQFSKYKYICTFISNIDQVLQVLCKVDNTIQKSALK